MDWAGCSRSQSSKLTVLCIVSHYVSRLTVHNLVERILLLLVTLFNVYLGLMTLSALPGDLY